ncbi:MAG: substrate-binding domain-containing protein [bacterium]
MKLEIDLAWRIGPDLTKAVPSLLFQLLQGISAKGSLSAAAKHCGVSYRNAWNLITEWSDYLESPLINATRGRGAELSPLGERLVWGLEYARESMNEVSLATAASIRNELDRVLNSRELNSLTVHASHCLSHDVLRKLYLDQTGKKLDLIHSGSGTSLEHLQAGECHVAGFHLADGRLRKKFCARYLQFFNPQGVKLIQALKRRQGLIVARGNPIKLMSISDLVENRARIINRQINSGTRLLFDELLSVSQLNPADIVGYDDVEFTHTAVSALIAENSADAALGTEAAANKFNLDFIPLVTESYFYAISEKKWEDEEVKVFRRLLAGSNWKRIISQIEGYDVTQAGTVEDGVEVLGVSDRF